MVASEPTVRLGGAALRGDDTRPTLAGPSQLLAPSLVLALACLIGLVPEDSHAAGPRLHASTGAPAWPAMRAAPGLRSADLVAGLGAPLLLGPPPRTTPRRLPGAAPPEPEAGEAPPAEDDAAAESPGPGTLPGQTGPPGPGPSLSPLSRPAPNFAPAEADDPAESADDPADDDAPPPAEVAAPVVVPIADPAAAEPEPVEVTSRFVKGRSVPPFWIDRTYTTHRTRALTLPPLFVHRTPAANHPEKLFHFDLSLTTGWYSQRVGKRRWLSPLGLFFGTFSERTSAWGSVALLMGYKRVGEQFNFGQFPFVWRWGNKSVKNLVVVPFHYHQKTPDSLRGFSAVLFWYGHKNTTDKDPLNDLRYFLGVPLFYRVTRGTGTANVFVPLYVGGESKARGLKWHTVLPFVHWQSSEFGNRKDLWTLFYVQRSDKARSRKSWAIPPLLTFSVQTPTRRLFSATPLVWRSENRDRGSVAWSVFPWVSYRDPEQRNRVLFPLLWQFSDLKAGATTTALVPLGWIGRGRDRNAPSSWGFLPALSFGRRQPGGRSFQVFAGAFVHTHDPSAYAGKGSRQLVLGPLAVYNQQGARRDFGLLPALTFFGRDGTRSYQVVTPLFWHRRDTDPERPSNAFMFGPVYGQKLKTGFHGGLAPVAMFGRDDHYRYAVVPPLLFGHVHDVAAQRTLTISPVFARSKGPDHRTLGVLNLFWDVKRGADERHTAFFPLFYRRQLNGRALTLTPLAAAIRTPERQIWSAAALAYGYRDRKDATGRGFGLVPLVFYDRRKVEGGVASNLVVAPLFARHRAPSEDLDMWSPLVWRTAFRGDHPRKNLAVIPFYFRQRQPEGVDVDAGLLLPFFYSRDKIRRTHTIIAGPFFHRLSRTQLHTGIAPVYWWMDSAEKRRLIALPIIFHQADKIHGEHTTIAPPLWFDRKRPNGRRSWVAFPFAVGVKGQFNFTRFGLLPPLYYDIYRLGKNYRFTGFVPLLFRYQKCGFREEDDDRCQYTLWGSAPFFLYGRDGMGRRSHGALMLYYYDKDPGGTRFLTLLGGANIRPKERLTWYVLNVGHTTTRQFKTTVVFPLYFRKAYRTEDRSTTVIAPPLFVGVKRRDYKWFQSALMFWHFRRPHKVSTIVAPPIFYTTHSYAERRMTWLLPLFLRDNNWAKDSTFTGIFPLLAFQRRRGEDNDFVQFPLIWHIERGENQGTFGAFVWWDIRAKGKTTQVVPGLWARERKRGRDLQVLGPGLAWWYLDTPRKGLHWRALFGLVGGGNDGADRYMQLFWAKIPLKPKKVWEPRRKRAKARIEAQPATPAPQPVPQPAAQPVTPAPQPAAQPAQPTAAPEQPVTVPETSPPPGQ